MRIHFFPFAVILLCPVFLLGQFQEVEDPATSGDTHPSESLEPILRKWNESINSRSFKQLSTYFADTVLYYGGKKTSEEAVKSKEGALKNSPSFQQEVSDIMYRSATGGIEVCFKKACTENEKTKTYDAYLLIDPSSLEILAESDRTTDKVMAQKAKAESLQDGKHCFEVEGTIWPVDAEAAPYYSRYELELKKGKVTGVGEYYSWAMRSSYTLSVKGSVQPDLLMNLTVEALGPTYPENADDKLAWAEDRKFSKGKLLTVQGGGSTDAVLLEVPCGK